MPSPALAIQRAARTGVVKLPLPEAPYGNVFPNPRAAYTPWAFYPVPQGGPEEPFVRRLDTDGVSEDTCVRITGSPYQGATLTLGLGGDGNTGTLARYPRFACVPEEMIFVRLQFKKVSGGLGVGGADPTTLRMVGWWYEDDVSGVDPGSFITAGTMLTWIENKDYTQGQWVEMIGFCAVPTYDPLDPESGRVPGYADIRIELATSVAAEFRVTDVQITTGGSKYPAYRVPDDGLSPAVEWDAEPTFRNILKNPNFESNADYWFGFDSVGQRELPRSTNWAENGTQSLRFTGTVRELGTIDQSFISSRVEASGGAPFTEAGSYPATPGLTYSARAAVNIRAIDASGQVRIGFVFFDSGGVPIDNLYGSSKTTVGVHDVFYRDVAPAGTVSMSVRVIVQGVGLVTTFDIEVDALMVHEGYLRQPYIDGDMDGPVWEGAARASASVWVDAPHHALTLPPPPSAAPPHGLIVGVNDNTTREGDEFWPGLYDEVQMSLALSRLGAGPGAVFRFPLNPIYNEGIIASGTGNVEAATFTQYEAHMDVLIAHGQKAFPLFFAVPNQWKDNENFQQPPNSANFAKVARFVELFIDHFGEDNIFAVELWNEPNLLGKRWAAAGAQGYAAALTVFYNNIKAAYPDMKVVMAGLAGSAEVGWGYDDYLTAMYTAGLENITDALNAHIYPAVPSSDYSGADLGTVTWERQIRLARLAAGSSLPLWVTETGLSTTQSVGFPWPSPNTQLTKVGGMNFIFDYWARHPFCEMLLIHSLIAVVPLGYGDSSNDVFFGLAHYDIEDNYAPIQPERDAMRAKFQGGAIAP